MRYRIQHGYVQFGADVILENIDFEIHDREKIAVVGRNGCGKTTLLKLIAGDISVSNPDSDEKCRVEMAGKQEIGFLHQVKTGKLPQAKRLKKYLRPFLPVKRSYGRWKCR